MKKEFKIGDKVKIIRNTAVSRNNVGDIGIITSLHDSHDGRSLLARIQVEGGPLTANNSYLTEIEHYIEEFPTFKILKERKRRGGITAVQNSEGNIFGIGDTVCFLPQFARSIQNRELVMKITGFRYRNDKTNLCAITNTHSDYGVGIEKIQHIVNFKKEEEFVLPENWHVVVTAENQIKVCNWRGFSDSYLAPIGYIVGMTKYSDGGIEKGHNRNEFIKSPDPHGYDFGEEITFEQFKKYVLKEEDRQVTNYNNLVQQAVSQEIPKEETLLEKAERIFKPGVKFKGLGLASPDSKNQIFTVKRFLGINSLSGNMICSIKEIGVVQAVISADGTQIAEIVEEVVEESNLDKARRLYPVGTAFKSLYNSTENTYIVTGIAEPYIANNEVIHVSSHMNGVTWPRCYKNIYDPRRGWAEIVTPRIKVGDH